MASNIHVLEIYRTRRKGYRWRAMARNLKIVAASTEEYAQFRGVKRNLLRTVAGIEAFAVPGHWPRLCKVMVLKRVAGKGVTGELRR